MIFYRTSVAGQSTRKSGFQDLGDKACFYNKNTLLCILHKGLLANISLAHIHEISKKVSSGIGALKRVRPFVSMHTTIKINKSLMEPHFDYCSVVWDGLSQQLNHKLQKLQNRAVRVITKSSIDTSSRYLLKWLGWDNLSIRWTKQ